jgi:hypothetical protein
LYGLFCGTSHIIGVSNGIIKSLATIAISRTGAYDKFQAIIINPKRSDNSYHSLKIGEYEIQTQSSVELVGIEIDDHLYFTNHITTLLRKAAGQLNYLLSKKKCLNTESKRVLIESFIRANFNYCPLVWMFCNANLRKFSHKTLSEIQKEKDYLLRLQTLRDKECRSGCAVI